MPARHNYLVHLRRKQPNSLLVDSGNVSDQAKRLPIILDIMRLDGYDAVGTGNLDAALGPAYANAIRDHKLPLVRALPRGDGIDPLTTQLYTRKLLGHTFGVTAAAPAPAGQDPEAYLAKLTQVLEQLRGKCDFLLLLSQLGLDRDRELARRCGDRGPNAIVGNLDARRLLDAEQVGGVTLLPTGAGGITVGRADVEFPRSGAPRLVNIGVPSTRGFDEDQHAKALVQEYVDLETQQFATRVAPGLLGPVTPKDVGDAPRCGTCHPMEVASWRTNRHSHAMETLYARKRLIPECIECHSSRFRRGGVFDKDARGGHVDCTGCHPIAAAGASTRCPKKATPTQGEKTCLPCHTPLHSPKFTYPEYLDKIRHRPPPGWTGAADAGTNVKHV